MDFTDAFRIATSNDVSHSHQYSPGSTLLATLHHMPTMVRTKQIATSMIQVRVSHTLQLVQSWTVPIHAQALRWSPGGKYLMTYGKESLVVFGMDGSSQNNKLDYDIAKTLPVWADRSISRRNIQMAFEAGAEGMSGASWVDDETICISTSENLTAHLYDVKTAQVTVIKAPKAIPVLPSPSKRFAAVLTVQNGLDEILILQRCVEGYWMTIRSFPTLTNDAVGLSWSPDELYLCVWEGPLECKAHFFSVMGILQATLVEDEQHQSRISTLYPTDTESRSTGTFIAHGGVGIRNAIWSPLLDCVLVTTYHNAFHLVRLGDWNAVSYVHISEKISENESNSNLLVWKEPMNWKQETGGNSIISFERQALPIVLPTINHETKKLVHRTGISWSAWNPTVELLAIRCHSMNSTVFVYKYTPFRSPVLISILVFASAVTQSAWRPQREVSQERGAELAIATNTDAIYYWRWRRDHRGEVQVAEAIPIPMDNFYSSHISFAPNAHAQVLISQRTGMYCCAMEAQDAFSTLQEGEQSANHV